MTIGADKKDAANQESPEQMKEKQKEEKSHLKSQVCQLVIFNLDQKRSKNEEAWELENQANAEKKGKLIEQYFKLPDLARSDYEFLIKRCNELLTNDAVIMPEHIRSIHQQSILEYKRLFEAEVLAENKSLEPPVSEIELYFCLRFLICDGKFLRLLYDKIIEPKKFQKSSSGDVAKAFLEVFAQLNKEY